MKKKVLAGFLTFCMALSVLTPAKPMEVQAEQTTYISEIFVATENKAKNAKNALTNAGATVRVDHDLNCDAGGDYVYVGYKTTTDPNQAIRGLVFSGSKASSVQYNGIEYSSITKVNGCNGDFNEDGGGDYIYLYYSKDVNAGLPITSLGFCCTCEDKYMKDDNPKVRNVNGYIQECNEDAGGEYVYLTYSSDLNSIDKSTQQSVCEVYSDPNNIPVSAVIHKNWLESNNIVRNWVTIANAIDTDNLTKSGQKYRMQVGELKNTNNPQMAAKEITGDEAVTSCFSTTDMDTFYLKGNNAGLIFTNFQYVDNADFLTLNGGEVEVGDTVGELEERGFKITTGTPESSTAKTVENNTVNTAMLTTGLSNETSVLNRFEVSDTKASSFSTQTMIGLAVTQSFEYGVPGIAGGSTDVTATVEETFTYSSETSKTRTEGSETSETKIDSSEVNVEVPAHTKCSVLQTEAVSQIQQTYSGACILTYDVYYIKDNKYYHFTGNSDARSAYSSATENVYHRAISNVADGLNDKKNNSASDKEATVDWSAAIKYHPNAESAIYELYRKLPVAPYGGSLTSTVKEVKYTAGAYEPIYDLAKLIPSETNITMYLDGDDYDFEYVTLSAKDAYDVDWYGFHESTSGEWEVVSGPLEIKKNEAGNLELHATGIGTAVVRYNPSNISEKKITENFDNRGITVTIKASDKYLVKFVDADGTVLKEESVVAGNDATPPANPTKKGYTFSGWSGSYTKVGSDLVLTATYSANKYTIAYNRNNGKGYMDSITAEYDKEVTVPAATFTRKGFLFESWNTKADGTGVDYLANGAVKNLTDEADGTAILYAMWGEVIENVALGKTSVTMAHNVSEEQMKEELAKINITGTYAEKDVDDPAYGMNAEAQELDSSAMSLQRAASNGKKKVQLVNNKDAWSINGTTATGTFKAPEGSVFSDGSKSIQLKVTISKTGTNNNVSGNSPTQNSVAKEDSSAGKVAQDNAVVNPPAKNTVLTDNDSNMKYKVTKSGATDGAVAVSKPMNKKLTKIVIPDSVTIDGITYKVTGIEANAFKGCSKLKSVTIGKNVTTIGKKAFYKCKALKNITIKTTKLTKKKVGASAFKGIYSKATIKVPKKKMKSYKTILNNKGVGKKAKYKKM